MNLEDLGLVPTDAMLDELKKRFDHLVFAGTKIGGAGRNDEEHRIWHGHTVYCAGLAVGLVRFVQDGEYHEDVEPD